MNVPQVIYPFFFCLDCFLLAAFTQGVSGNIQVHVFGAHTPAT
jgi:hypothetical protein